MHRNIATARILTSTALAVLLVLAPSPGGAEQAGVRPEPFDVRDEMIPMRDGVKLNTKIFVPADTDEALPFVMLRTPYGIGKAERNFRSYLKAMAEDGYIFVFQDIRGKFESEGKFVMLRPARAPDEEEALDEGTDTYDTIEWLLENVTPNNGRVGMLGVSYLGWTTIMAALEPHPALKAISPQASPADMWIGDDFHHNGAFRLSYGFEYAYSVGGGKESQKFRFDRYDTYDWYLGLGPLSNVNERFLHSENTTWNDYVEHPDYDEFWKRQTVIPHIRDVKVPTLNVAGWWDAEDFYGPFRIYSALEEHDTEDVNYLVAGPWTHGGWAYGPGDEIEDIEFGSATGVYFRNEIQAPFFAYFLRDEGRLDLPEALTFESGSNRWRRWDSWPPAAAEPRALYFGGSERLSFEKPEGDGGAAFDSYVSDPAAPVPYRHRPIQATWAEGGSEWSSWMLEDQRFVDDRPDVLSWESEPLTEDVTIAGEVKAHLFASTTGSDADWIVKLIDVYPEYNPEDWDVAGYQLMVSGEVFRGRYRESFEESLPIEPDAVVVYEISLHTQSYTFLKGHRIMVQVQSTWFPIIDRNPQTFVPNIFKATPSDFQKATHRIHRSAEHPSHVTIPVVRAADLR